MVAPSSCGESIDFAVCGLSCPKCGGRKLAALWVKRRGNLNIRLRECNECRQRVRTSEKVTDTVDRRKK